MPLTNLCLAEGAKIPVKIEQLITKIEMLGLYSEGIYRKSGVNSKIKELKAKMSEPTTSNIEIDYESYNVHVLANVLKSFLRDMPEPLLTFDRYDDFLRAADLPDTNIRVQTLLSLIKKLPPAHHFLLERLIFHLALVAQREKHNRMSASSLAIVFAPCVLRTNRLVPAQDSLNDIGRQTKCIETLITQKMLNVKNTLADIDTLDTAAHTATTRLSTLRSSKIFSSEELITPRSTNQSECETEEMILEGHIQEIKKEKALLTSTLPNLVRATSDDDLLSTDLEGEGGSLDDLSTSTRELNKDNSIQDSDQSGEMLLSLSKDNNQHYNNNETTSIGLSYNLRDQNIDYIPSSSRATVIAVNDQQQSHDNASKLTSYPSSTTKHQQLSRWSSTNQQQNVNYLISMPSITEATSAATISGNYCNIISNTLDNSNNGSNNSSNSCNNSNTVNTSSNKPVAIATASVRNIYFPHSSSLGTTGATIATTVTTPVTTTATTTTVVVNKSSIKDDKNPNRQGKRKQGSLDDEPIMV